MSVSKFNFTINYKCFIRWHKTNVLSQSNIRLVIKLAPFFALGELGTIYQKVWATPPLSLSLAFSSCLTDSAYILSCVCSVFSSTFTTSCSASLSIAFAYIFFAPLSFILFYPQNLFLIVHAA